MSASKDLHTHNRSGSWYICYGSNDLWTEIHASLNAPTQSRGRADRPFGIANRGKETRWCARERPCAFVNDKLSSIYLVL